LETIMKKLVLAAAAGLTLVSAAAYAQMQYPRAGEQPVPGATGQFAHRQGGMMQGMEHGRMMQGGREHAGRQGMMQGRHDRTDRMRTMRGGDHDGMGHGMRQGRRGRMADRTPSGDTQHQHGDQPNKTEQ
jgi:hypothetical protein